MSIIRCLENPEGLYIWDNGCHINVMCNMYHGEIISVPTKQFYSVIQAYLNYPGRTIKEGDLKLEVDVPELEFRLRFSYKKYSIPIYPVTWEYIVNNVKKFSPRSWKIQRK